LSRWRRGCGLRAEHQSLLHFVGQSPWDETALLRAVREAALPAMTAAGPVEAWRDRGTCGIGWERGTWP
jgi:SRSO17 transposase